MNQVLPFGYQGEQTIAGLPELQTGCGCKESGNGLVT